MKLLPSAQTALALLVLYTAAAAQPNPSNGPTDPVRPERQPCDGDTTFIRFINSFAVARSPPSDSKAHGASFQRRRRRRSLSSSRSTASSPSSDGLSSATTTTASNTPTPVARRRSGVWEWTPLDLPRRCATPTTPPSDVRGLPQLFVGQLKRDCAAECVRALISQLAPTVRVVHVEPSINSATGQGRGCAWVYVATEADAEVVLSLHHRVFIDLDPTSTRTGYVACHDNGGQDTVEALREYAARRGAIDVATRKRRQMPCQPLVVERAVRAQPQPSYSYDKGWYEWASIPPGSIHVAPGVYRYDPYSIEVFAPPSYATTITAYA